MNDLNAMCALGLQSGYSILRTCIVICSPLMLKSTGCLAPLAPMAIGGAASTLANSIFNIVIVVIYCETRESTNKDYCCCCCFCLKYVTNMIVGHCLVSLFKKYY